MILDATITIHLTGEGIVRLELENLCGADLEFAAGLLQHVVEAIPLGGSTEAERAREHEVRGDGRLVDGHACDQCERTFATTHALAVHRSRSHKAPPAPVPFERVRFDEDAARAAAAASI